MSNFDFNSFRAREIRDLLKTKTHLLRAGIPADHAAVETLSQVIGIYRRRVGLETYLSQMLGKVATIPIQECLIYYAGGERVNLHGAANMPVQRFIASSFSDASLLDGLRVVAGGQERYL